jgi:hypothetical protein
LLRSKRTLVEELKKPKRIKRKWKTYELVLFENKKDKENLGCFYLPDKTAVIVQKDGGITVGLTKAKFASMVEKQLKNKSKYISVTFSKAELGFMIKAISEFHKDG